MVTIATFNEPDKAKRLKQRFQQAGIDADIHNEGHLQAVAFMSRPKANAKIMVDDANFERASRCAKGGCRSCSELVGGSSMTRGIYCGAFLRDAIPVGV